MRNRDEAEAHIAAGGAVEEGMAFFCWNIRRCVRIMHIFAYKSNQIRIRMEWKYTYVVMNTTSESSCPNNTMQLDTLICRESPAKSQNIASGGTMLKILLVKILFVDCLPGLLMNFLSLFRITKQTPCELNYEHAQTEFVLRIMGQHKLVFTLPSNFYLCDMATSVFRSNGAKVKDAF